MCQNETSDQVTLARHPLDEAGDPYAADTVLAGPMQGETLALVVLADGTLSLNFKAPGIVQMVEENHER